MKRSNAVAGLAVVLAVCWIGVRTEVRAGEALPDREWSKLERELKKDIERFLRARTPQEEAAALPAAEKALRRMHEVGRKDGAEALVDFLKNPSPRLVPLERRKKEIGKEIDRLMHLAEVQGGLVASDNNKVSSLIRELKDLNKILFRETALERLAVTLLGHFTAPDAVEWILEESLENRFWSVRIALLAALVSLRDARANEVLADSVREEDPGIRSRALESLALRDPEAAWPHVVHALEDDFWQVRVVAIDALGDFGDIRAVELLIDRLKGEPGRIREDIAAALKRLTGRSMDPDPDLWKSWWSVEANREQAGEICSARKPVVFAARPKLWSKEASVRTEGVRELAGLGRGTGFPVALEAFASPDPAMREAGLAALETLGDLRAVDVLIRALHDEDDPLASRIEQVLVALTGCKEDWEGDAEFWEKWWKENEADVREKAPPPAASFGDDKAPAGHVKTGVTFYGVPVHSKNMVFVIDVSLSMNEPAPLPPGVSTAPAGERDPVGSGPAKETRLEIAKWELKKAIAGLSEESTFNIIVFAFDVEVFSQRKMVPATASGKASAYAFVNKLEGRPATNIYDALHRAFTLADPKDEQKNVESGVDTIFLLSDGMPTVGDVVETDAILSAVRDLNAIRKIAIHIIGLVPKKKSNIPSEDPERMRSFLKRLAEENDGKFVEK